MGKRTDRNARHWQPAMSSGKVKASSVMLLVCLSLIVVSAAVLTHWPVLSAQAISFDDDDYLKDNALVQHPSWTSAGQFLREVTRPSTVPGYYQPLAMISLMLDYSMAGRPDNLRPFHRTSLILHAANTLLVIVLLYLLFGQPWVAAGVGLLFGVHPMTVEPIAWIGERKTLLATFFVLGSLIAYVRYARCPGWRTYLACMFFFGLALLSKPTSTPLPAVLLVLDYWPLRRMSRRSLLEKAPFFLVAGISAAVTVVSQRHVELSAFRGLSIGQTFLLICHNLVLYPSHMVWPWHLSSLYPFPDDISLSNAWLLVCIGANAIVLSLAVVSMRWTRVLFAGWLCFIILLAPTLLNMSYSPSVAWDKYAYLPALGILLILARGLQRIWLLEDVQRRRQVRAGVVILTVVVGSLFATATRRYLNYWQTTEGFCAYMLQLAPKAAILYNHRGLVVHYRRGDCDQAIRDCTKAINLKPDYADAYLNRGNAYFGKDDYGNAIRDYGKAIATLPGYTKAYNNRAVAYFVLKEYDNAWSDVRKCRSLGGSPPSDFVRALAEATGRTE